MQNNNDHNSLGKKHGNSDTGAAASLIVTVIAACRLAALLLAACIFSAGCTGSGRRFVQTPATPRAQNPQTTQGALGAELDLPSPAALKQQALGGDAASKGSSYVPSDLYKNAEDFNPSFLHRHVMAGSGGLIFDPNWKPGDASIDSLAFAFYDFHVAGYGGNPALYYGWVTPPDEPGSVYFALANWDAGEWNWYAGNADGQIVLPELTHYLGGGDTLVVCVVATGIYPVDLDWLRLGSLPPEPSLSATPHYGLTPLTVDFDATGSTDPDGTVAEYKWDPQGDGTFEQSTGADPTYSFAYAAPGDYAPAVRVIDNDGVYADKAVDISAADTAGFSYGAPVLDDEANSVVVCDDGHLFLVGDRSSTDVISHIFVAKVSPNGSADFVKEWVPTYGSSLQDAVLADDSYIYACGFTENGIGRSGLIQKWSQDGELLWSKSVGSTDEYESFNALIVRGDSIYVCGRIGVNSLGKVFAVVARLDRDANLTWNRAISCPLYCEYKDMAYYSTIQAGGDSIRLCGYYDYSTLIEDALYASYDPDGNLTACKTWGTQDSTEKAYAITLVGFTHPSTYISGDIVSNAVGTAFVSKVGGTSVTIDPPGTGTNLIPVGMLGLNMLFEVIDGAAGESAVLAGFDNSLILQSESQYFSTGGGAAIPQAIAGFGGNGLVWVGTQHGALPTAGDPALKVQPIANSWVDRTPTTPSLPPWQVSATTTTTTDPIDFSFDRQADDLDSLVYFSH